MEAKPGLKPTTSMLSEAIAQMIGHAAADVDRRGGFETPEVLAAAGVAAPVDRHGVQLALEPLLQVRGQEVGVLGGAARRGHEGDRARTHLLHPRAVGVDRLAEGELTSAEENEPAVAGESSYGHGSSEPSGRSGAESAGDRFAHLRGRLHHLDAGGRERLHLRRGRPLAAGHDRAGVAHAACPGGAVAARR